MVEPSAKKQIVDYLQEEYQRSIHLLCQTVGLSRSLYYRKSIKDDSEVEAKLLYLAERESSRGFDWYYLKIRQEGLKWNRKRVLRVYRKLKLGLRIKRKKRINKPYEYALGQPIAPNISWSMDFMSDSLQDGRTVRLFNIIDDYNREALALEAGLSFPAQKVIRILDKMIFLYGKPDQIRVDNGPEFTSHILGLYCQLQGINLVFIPPGKPHKNGYIERFNRTYREDVLDAYLFENIEQLQFKSDLWKDRYNEGHPHQSLGGKSPIQFRIERSKVVEAYKQVKAKWNDSLQSSALTCFTPSSIQRHVRFQEKS